MGSEHEAFLRKIREDEDDWLPQLVFADWLDERGESDEATRWRNYGPARKWLKEFASDHTTYGYDWLVEQGRDAVEEPFRHQGTPWYSLHCRDDDSLCDTLYQNKEQFWKNWSIVTGIPLPDDLIENCTFSCSC